MVCSPMFSILLFMLLLSRSLIHVFFVDVVVPFHSVDVMEAVIVASLGEMQLYVDEQLDVLDDCVVEFPNGVFYSQLMVLFLMMSVHSLHWVLPTSVRCKSFQCQYPMPFGVMCPISSLRCLLVMAKLTSPIA